MRLSRLGVVGARVGNADGVGFAPAGVALDPSLRSGFRIKPRPVVAGICALPRPRPPVAALWTFEFTDQLETPTGKVRDLQRLAPSNVWPDFSFHLPEARRFVACAAAAASGSFYRRAEALASAQSASAFPAEELSTNES